MRYILCLTASRRKTAISLIAASIRWVNNRVNKVNVPIITHQHITFNGIKYVVMTIGIIFTIILWMET